MNRWEAADRRFPVFMKYTGLFGAVSATIAAFLGVAFAAPLLGLFGTMMGVGQVVDAIRYREGDQRRIVDATHDIAGEKE